MFSSQNQELSDIFIYYETSLKSLNHYRKSIEENSIIDDTTVSFLRKNTKKLSSLEKANAFMYKTCGILHFFNNKTETSTLQSSIEEHVPAVEEPGRREYGDFQTNNNLAGQIVRYISEKGACPEFVLEPTCGKGNFIIASIKEFSPIKKIVGIDIYQPYIWETKFKILSFYIHNKTIEKPEIEIIHANVFEFPFKKLALQTGNLKTLVIGNPPWVTNSELGSINSKNLPQKSNFKRHSGLDAITGKGNFDIGEYITLLILKNFDKHSGQFSFLIKNSVVKNLIYDQKKNRYRIGKTEKLNIDSKREFNVSVDACLFFAGFDQEPQLTCQELDFYAEEKRTTFGWHKDKFVYSVSGYDVAYDIDGESQFCWRQGVKHDCSKIMELERFNSHYLNGLKQEVKLENGLLYGLLKSSDLKTTEINTCRKLVIVTQKRTGQDTSYIKQDFPLTFKYLNKNRNFFDKRKSSIYKGKPEFSIFGIGEYSFALYKVAVSGLYKRTHFTLVFPENDKPVMLDDTCYFIGFNKLEYAEIAHFLLNHRNTQQFIKSIIFPDSKRPITKDILMRIDFSKLYDLTDFSQVQNSSGGITEQGWTSFGDLINKKTVGEQMTLF